MNYTSKLNNQDIQDYFNFLSQGKASEIFTCAIFDKEGVPVPGLSTIYGKAEKLQGLIANEVERQGRVGNTLHCVLNRTSDKGRKLKDVTGVRVLAVDIDEAGTVSEEVLVTWCKDFEVGMIVESSPGKYHLYWQLSEVGCSLETWEGLQSGLAWRFGGDRCLCQINKMLRVPGVPRILKSRIDDSDETQDCQSYFVPRIVWNNPDARVLRVGAELSEIFPLMGDWIEEAEKEAEKVRKALREARKQGLAGYKAALRAPQSGKKGRPGVLSQGTSGASKIGRNTIIYEAVKAEVYEKGLSLEEALELGKGINQEFDVKLDSRELERTCESAWDNGTAGRELRESREKAEEEAVKKLFEEAREVDSSEGQECEKADSSGTESGKQTIEFKLAKGTDEEVIWRVIKKWGHGLCEIEGVVHAFDPIRKVWTAQTKSKTKLAAFIKDCVGEMLRDEDFINENYRDKKTGKISEGKRQEIFKYWKASTKTLNLIRLLCTSEQIKVMRLSDFDSDPFKLLCANGVVNLKTGELRDAKASDYLMHQTGIKYEAGAKCPIWESVVAGIFAGNEDPERMVRFVQEIFGYSVSGLISECKVFVHVGIGANGKSTLFKVLKKVTGGYSTNMDGGVLGRGKKGLDGGLPVLERIGAAIELKRVICVDDLGTKFVWRDGLVKMMTASELPCRKLYQETNVVPNRGKFHVGCNDIPDPEDENRGLLRRLCIIPYNQIFTQSTAMDAKIDSMIASEGSGILNWAIKGLQRILVRENQGIEYPEELEAELEDYKEDNYQGSEALDELIRRSRSGNQSEKPDREIWLDDLLDWVNDKIRAKSGSTDRQLTAKSLGRLLLSKYKIKTYRKWDDGAQKKRRYIVLKMSDTLDTLF